MSGLIVPHKGFVPKVARSAFIAANATLVVDINTIPQAAIQGVEVITGGASAVYGPDAIAGLASSRGTNEDCYAFQRLFRTAIGTHNVDNCSRVCHSPTAYGLRRSLGLSGGTSTFDSIEAAQVLERAVSISSNTAATRFLLGEAYRDDNRLERAKEAYRDAVVIDADFGPAWAGLAAVLARTGPRDEFEAAMKQLTRLEPELARQFLESSRSPRN